MCDQKKQLKAEQRVLERKLFREWKAYLENTKLTSRQAVRRAKSLSRKLISREVE